MGEVAAAEPAHPRIQRLKRRLNASLNGLISGVCKCGCRTATG